MPDNQEKTQDTKHEETENASDISKAKPAVFVDSFFVELNSADRLIRLTFGEGTTDRLDRIRLALMMTLGDARELATRVTKLLDNFDAKNSPPEAGQ